MDKNKLKDNVKTLLKSNPSLRESRNHRLAVWEYWALFEKARYGVNKRAWLKHLTMPEDIIREIRNQNLTIDDKII